MLLKRFFRLVALCMIPSMLLCACGAGGSAPSESVTEDPFKDAYHKADPSEDDTLYILTAAASNSYYFLDELYGMLAATGVKAKVCTLMRSSTGINAFHDFWKNGEKLYNETYSIPQMLSLCQVTAGDVIEVQLTCNAKGKGKIAITFKDEDELQRIITLLDKLKA